MFRSSLSVNRPWTLATASRPASYVPFRLAVAGRGRTLVVVAIMLAVAAGVGAATVAIGDAFPTRPIFYLGLPLIVTIAIALVMSPRWLLIGLVLCRAILDPVFQQAALPGIGGLGGVVNFVVIGLALILFVSVQGRTLTRDAWLPWLPFIAVMALAVVRAPDKFAGLRSWISLLSYAAVYYGAFHAVRTPKDLDRILRWLLLSAIPVAVYAVISYVLEGPAYVVEAGESTSGRLSSPLGHPNILGFYFVVILAAWLAKERSRPAAPLFTFRGIGWTVYLLMVVGIIAGTQTRSAWFGALLLILIYGVTINRTYIVLLATGALLALMVPDVRDRVLDLASNNEVYTYSKLNSYAWRQYLWSSALAQMSPLSYLVGSGQGAFSSNSIGFFPLAGGRNWNAHNVYVQLLYDAGVLGVASFAAVFAGCFAIVWQKRALLRPVRVAILTLVVGFAFMSYSDNMLDYLVVNWNCWFLIGVVAAAGRLLTSQPQSHVATGVTP